MQQTKFSFESQGILHKTSLSTISLFIAFLSFSIVAGLSFLVKTVVTNSLGNLDYNQFLYIVIGSAIMFIVSWIMTILWYRKVLETSYITIAIIYTFYILSISFFVGSLMIQLNSNEIILAIGSTAATFLVLSILSKFVKMSNKLIQSFVWISLTAIIVMPILFMIIIFTGSDSVYFLYFSLGTVLIIFYTVFDLVYLNSISSNMDIDSTDRNTVFKFALFFGFRLLSDLVNILIRILIIISRNKK